MYGKIIVTVQDGYVIMVQEERQMSPAKDTKIDGLSTPERVAEVLSVLPR